MASPLQYFRRHQGYILAVLGVILIVTWVIGDSLTNLFDPGPQTGRAEGNHAVIAQWKLGNITRGDLDTAEWEHDAVVRFLLAVIRRAQENDAKPQAPFLSIQPDGIDLGLAMRSDDPTLVQIMLFAQKGKEMGIVVDQTAMMNYLTNLGGFALDEADFHELARETVSQHRDPTHGTPLVTVTQLFERLKLELTSLQAQSMFSAGLTGFSTGELWEYHEQLHRRNKIEAFPIQVADYHKRFKESDAKEDELRKIYDEGKDRTPHPERYEPGFRQPQKLAFGYVKIDFQKFLDAAKKNVSEERLQEEYQKEIAAGNFRNLKFDAGDATTPPPEGTIPPKTDEAVSPLDPASDDVKPPAGEKKPQDDSKEPAETKPGEKPAEKTKEAPAADEEAKNENKECQEEPAQSTEAKSEPEKSAKGDEAAAKDAPAKDEAAEEAAKPEEKKDETKPSDSAAETDATSEKTAEESKPPEPEFKPLSEVRDQLLNQLASPDARGAHDAAINEIVRAVSDYGTKYTRWVEDKKAGSKVGAQDPGELKLSALAARHGLTVGKTPLADQFAIAATELGQQAAFRSAQGTLPFADGAFYENRPLYAPQEVSSIFGETTFVYWRTGNEPSEQVPFDKARKQVVAAWIHQQAASAAQKDAEAIAAKAAKASSLKEVLTEDQAKQVVEPLSFSWFTRGASPLAFGGSPSLSEVKGIPLAGNEFMKEVFRLQVGQAGVAVDQPHKTVYVVRLVAQEPTLDIRREMFLAGMQAGRFGDLVSYALMASSDAVREAVEELREEYQLKWLDTPRFSGEM
ncbi:MAG TPA: hypothetical protein VMP01_23360 [Pirellulaceae bacterium]|nr:hypothetical protein [Pirellulaceae bacterium]